MPPSIDPRRECRSWWSWKNESWKRKLSHDDGPPSIQQLVRSADRGMSKSFPLWQSRSIARSLTSFFLQSWQDDRARWKSISTIVTACSTCGGSRGFISLHSILRLLLCRGTRDFLCRKRRSAGNRQEKVSLRFSSRSHIFFANIDWDWIGRNLRDIGHLSIFWTYPSLWIDMKF